MIIKYNIVRICIIFIFVLIFPLFQNQWLNLYLFDKNNFTIYKLLYYLSGLILPIFVCINSYRKFTFYKFKDFKIKNNYNVKGKSLLIIILVSLISLSGLILSYNLLNLKTFYNLIISDSKSLINIDIEKSIIFIIIISILLLFKKIKLFLKKISLITFFMLSIGIWYSKLNDIQLNDIFNNHFFIKFENYNFINIFFLLSIEIFFYIWSYFSYGTYLSDWKVPIPIKADLKPLLEILFFYLIITTSYAIF